MAGAARGWMLGLLMTSLGTVAQVPAPTAASSSMTHSSVSIQIGNSDGQTPLRIQLDRRVIFDSTPQPLPRREGGKPVVIGSFALEPGTHALTAEVPGTPTKAELHWSRPFAGVSWIVVHFYPGKGESGEPPFFLFSVQSAPYRTK